MDHRQIITIESGKRSGKPCIRGLRITVTDVLEYLASGMSVDEILTDFPDLTVEDIRACLSFAAEVDDSLVDDLILSDPSFRALVEKSKASPRRPFPSDPVT